MPEAPVAKKKTARKAANTVDPALVAEACALILDQLRSGKKPWIGEAGLARATPNDKVLKAAIKQLKADKLIAEAGKLDRKAVFISLEGREAKAAFDSMAREELLALRRGRIEVLPVTAGKLKALVKDAPPKVHASMTAALTALVKEGKAFIVKLGAQKGFLLRADLETVLGVPTVASPEARDDDSNVTALPAEMRPSPELTGARTAVLAAYRELRDESGRRNIDIVEILERSKVDVVTLHSVLSAEYAAGRANPTRGEPTAASQAALASAWVVAGTPHLMVELEQP